MLEEKLLSIDWKTRSLYVAFLLLVGWIVALGGSAASDETLGWVSSALAWATMTIELFLYYATISVIKSVRGAATFRKWKRTTRIVAWVYPLASALVVWRWGDLFHKDYRPLLIFFWSAFSIIIVVTLLWED